MKKFHFDLIVSSVVLVAMIVVILIQIIFRLMGNPLSWTEEVARWMLVWATFAGASYAFKNGGLIRVDFFDAMWPAAMTRVRERIYQMLFFVLLLILIIVGWQQAWEARNTALLSLPFSQMVPYLSIPVGAAMMLLQYFVEFLKTFQKKEDTK